MTSGTNLIQLSLQRPGFNLQVDLTLPARGITVLSGPSGSGKTTLLRCVAGLERPQQALVRIAGQVWQHSQPGLFVPTWRRPLGYVFQEASLFDHLNVLANLRYGLQRSPLRAQSTTLDAAVTLLGIGALLQRHPHQLSGGERQRVAIARALAMQPQLLLLDEPLAALDYARRQEILPWLERLRDELHIPMLYVTHAADEVARLADTLVAMDRGRVVAAGPAPEVFARIETPVVLGDDLGALLTGVVQERDAKWHLMRVQCEGLSLWLRDSGATVGHKVRLRVLARDVSLATEMPQHSSIQNILHCVVQTVLPDAHPSQTLLRVACGPAVLVARVTARAVDALQLVPGKTVWAQVKSVALIE